jgi:hypothetical protein
MFAWLFDLSRLGNSKIQLYTVVLKNSNGNTDLLFNMQRGHIANRELFTFQIMKKLI